MNPGHGKYQIFEVECNNVPPFAPRRLEEEIGCAARTNVPVLITGDPDEGREIACAIDRMSQTPIGSVQVIDCRQHGAFDQVLAVTPADPAPSHADRASIVLLQEVHALSPDEQVEVDERLAQMRAGRPADAFRIMASSSAPLFERVQAGSFDERLFYRLNVIHMIVA